MKWKTVFLHIAQMPWSCPISRIIKPIGRKGEAENRRIREVRQRRDNEQKQATALSSFHGPWSRCSALPSWQGKWEGGIVLHRSQLISSHLSVSYHTTLRNSLLENKQHEGKDNACFFWMQLKTCQLITWL